MSPTEEKKTAPLVLRNFRACAGLNEIVFRSGTPDGLASRLNDPDGWTKEERFIMEEITFLVDMRGKGERKEDRQKAWMDASGGFEIHELDRGSDNSDNLPLESLFEEQYGDSERERHVLRVDLLSKKGFFKYIDENWLSQEETSEEDEKMKPIQRRVLAMNRHGLPGMYEAFLAQKGAIRVILKAITRHLDPSSGGGNNKVLIHCTQGKDRTAIVSMLIQSCLQLSDQDIVDDYTASQGQTAHNSAAMNRLIERHKLGNIDRSMFTNSPATAMRETLARLRCRYGSISNYLTDIGFDESWQERLRASVQSRL